MKIRGEQMKRKEITGWRRIGRWAAYMTLVFVFALDILPVHGEYALDVTVGASKAWQPDALGYNGKMQGDPWRTRPFDNPDLRDVITRSMIGSFRFPGGTVANYYDWVNGQDNRQPAGYGDYTTANFKLAYDDAGFTPIYVVNMLTGTLQEALDGLQQAANEGLPITMVELGNEFYLSETDYVNKWPSGTEYGQDCQTWITAIKNQFPGVKCAIVSTMKAYARQINWHTEVAAACNNYDAVIIHWYEQSGLEPAVVDGDGTQNEQDTQWAAFTAPDGVKTMLSKPNHGWNLLRSENDLPSDVDIWLTEFNLKDSNGAVRQTWANGLFNANQIHEFLQDGRVSRIYLHNWLSSNKQACFGENNELDHVLTPHGQGSLTTTPYDFGAPGQVVRLYAEVMKGASTIAPLNFETAPQVNPPGYNAYEAIYGWKFTEGATQRAIVVNTSDTAFEIKTANIASAGSHMRQLSGNPITYVTGENDTLSYATAAEMPPVLRVPAYSVITIGGPADDAPTGTPQNAPVFSADPISKPNATAYEYYAQSLTGDASDPDGDALTFSKVSGPAWVTVWSDGTLAGNADNADAGLNQVVVKVTDSSGLTDQATVEFTVNTGTPPSPPPIAPRAYAVSEDTFVYSGAQADTVQTLDALLDIRSTASANFSRVPYIKFDINELPGTISNVTLHVYSVDLTAPVVAYQTDTGWSASTITWNSRPPFGTSLGTTSVTPGWNQIDITGLVTGTGIYSVALDEQNNSGRFYFSSSRGSNPPYVEITFANGGGSGNNAPSFTSNPIVEVGATEDAAYSSTLADDASDPDAGDTLSFGYTSKPGWLNIASDGALSGTPSNADVGLNTATVTVSDGNGGQDSATLEITVANVNDAPTFDVDPIFGSDATEGAAYSGTIAGTASDEDLGDTLSYSLASAQGWLSVASDGTLSGTPGAGDVGANVFTVQVDDGNGGSDTATLNITVDASGPSGPVIDHANADVIGSGTVSGSYVDTQASDNSYESITEVESGGKPSNRHSLLDHRWTLNVTGGNSVTFYVEAYKTANSEGDDFVFAYSTDNVNFTDMVTVTKTADDNVAQSYTLPNTLSGTVYIRVVDTDSSQGNNGLDTVFIDELYIVSDGETPPNQAPSFTSDPVVEVNATENAAYSSSIADNASDPESDPMTFSKVSGPAWLSVAANGDLSGTPGAGDVGLNSFTVQVDATGGSDTATLEITVDEAGSGDPLPGPASNPDPVDRARDVSLTTTLSWTAGSDAVSHNVYFGTVSGSLVFQGNQTGTTFDPGTLSNKTTYYWRIDEVNATGTTTGSEWQFKTVR
jgi:hypothetical protein